MGQWNMLYDMYERRLKAELSDAAVPAHIGVILDGNRRWAKSLGATASQGHRAGAGKISEFLQWSDDAGVSIVTLWLLSTDNLSRDAGELGELLRIICEAVSLLADQGRWKLAVVGDLSLLPEKVSEDLRASVARTADVQGMTVNIAVGYGGRHEITEAVRSMMQDHKFGKSGSTVVIEECMVGPEVTVLAFCDGEHLVPMLSSQDHKRAYDGNQGPNTGGMGAFCPSPNYTPAIAAECMEKIFLPTVKAMQAEGRPFEGVLYCGRMLTQDGPKVVEYNARFGDPETQPILSMLDTDLMDVFQACVNGTLDQVDIRWKEGAACCIVLASGGYPGSYAKGLPITGLEDAGQQAVVFHAGTKLGDDGTVFTNGGRVLGVTAVGGSLEEAIEQAYAACKPISFQDMHFRTDIGKV